MSTVAEERTGLQNQANEPARIRPSPLNSDRPAVTNLFKKLLFANRHTHRFKDEKGNPVPLSRLARNGPKALYSAIVRTLFHLRPLVPWISYDACRLLYRLLPRQTDVLEFGSGNSTIWFARHFRSVFSVEHDHQWYLYVKHALEKAELKNVHCVLREPSTYARFDQPCTGHLFDFVMLDGLDRSACAHAALRSLKPDAILYLDNSDKHPHGGDTRLAEQTLLSAAGERAGRVLYFTDFAPADFFVNQGMMLLFGRYRFSKELA